MSSRPLAVAILISIFFIAGIYEIYLSLQPKHSVYSLNSKHKWVGVIDMDYDHGIDIARIVKGEDVILVVDATHPSFQEIVRRILLINPLFPRNSFEIGAFDSNGDGVLNQEDPIFQHLHLVVFNPNGQGYQIRSLPKAGIRGIKINHLTLYGNHEVIMSDGSKRTLYETRKPGGTAIHTTNKGNTHTQLPESSNQ